MRASSDGGSETGIAGASEWGKLAIGAEMTYLNAN